MKKKFSLPALLIIGNEEKGITKLVKKNAIKFFSIPQKSKFNSLNASVASAIFMYEFYRETFK